MLTPANQLLVMGQIIWSSSVQSGIRTSDLLFYRWPNALTNCATQAHQNKKEEKENALRGGKFTRQEKRS
jgi:hypothetical protein